MPKRATIYRTVGLTEPQKADALKGRARRYGLSATYLSMSRVDASRHLASYLAKNPEIKRRLSALGPRVKAEVIQLVEVGKVPSAAIVSVLHSYPPAQRKK